MPKTSYHRLPLVIGARHEAGHAVMAHRRGGYVKRIIIGRRHDGTIYARASFAVPNLESFVLVLSAGVLALFLDSEPAKLKFQAFCDWVDTPDGMVQAQSAASDWMQILSLTGKPAAYGFPDFLERAVRPHFDKTIGVLSSAKEQIDDLTELVVQNLPGVGRLALKRFFAGQAQHRFAQWVDRPGIFLATSMERRSS